MATITPPYHFSIVATPAQLPLQSIENDAAARRQILYRGSIPLARNLSFVKRLRLRILVYLKKKQLKDEDVLVRWASAKGVELRWIKAEKMDEEKLGMGRTEVGDILKTILNPASYPLYIADVDGISHTTLVTACLRKLQGWHQDSIISEIQRFEPDYEDSQLVPFLTTYLTPTAGPSGSGAGTGAATSASAQSAAEYNLALPPPPYPTWLWPAVTSATGIPGITSGPPSSTPSNSNPASGNAQSGTGTGGIGIPLTRTITRERERDRATSSSTAAAAAVAQSASPVNSMLPFPHPLTARRHPTMKLTFPPNATPNSNSAASPTFAASPGVQNPLPIPSTHTSHIRSASVRSTAGFPGNPEQPYRGLVGAATSIISSGLHSISGHDPTSQRDTAEIPSPGVTTVPPPMKRFPRTVSFETGNEDAAQVSGMQSGGTSPEKLSRRTTRLTTDDHVPRESNISSPEGINGDEDDDGNMEEIMDDVLEEDGPYDADEVEDDEEEYESEEDEDEDEDEEDETQPASQYISALDLAGFS